MNTINTYNNQNNFSKPADINDDDWLALDLSDPLLMVC